VIGLPQLSLTDGGAGIVIAEAQGTTTGAGLSGSVKSAAVILIVLLHEVV
jgi:hypothetical protein